MKSLTTLPLLALLTLVCSCQSGMDAKSSPAKVDTKFWRGVHFMVQSDQSAATLIDQMPRLAAAGVNVVIAEVDYGYEFESHPEVRGDQFITKARAHELSKVARANGIRLIPQINCLGHQSWSKNTGPLLTKHPEFDETPGQYPNNKGIYCRSWCPQNPDVNAFVFPLIDDIIDGFEADAVHIGMDEVFIVASEHCPRCKGGDPAILFAKCVNDLHAHIVGQRKVEMLMWGDRLLDGKALHYGKWEGSENGTQAAIDLIPKDIIICDWHYEKMNSYPSIPLLMSKGFRVWPSSWQPMEGAQALSAFSKNQNDKHLTGFLVTTWGKAKIRDAADWPPLKDILKEWE